MYWCAMFLAVVFIKFYGDAALYSIEVNKASIFTWILTCKTLPTLFKYHSLEIIDMTGS